jgi:hypothetical protein
VLHDIAPAFFKYFHVHAGHYAKFTRPKPNRGAPGLSDRRWRTGGRAGTPYFPL